MHAAIVGMFKIGKKKKYDPKPVKNMQKHVNKKF